MKIALAALGMLLAGCRAGDPGPAACIPAGTLAIAGVRMEEARRLPAWTRLRERIPGLEAAASALAAWDGRELLVAAEGNFPAPPAGAAMASPRVALFGSEEKVRAALAQYRSGEAGAPELLSLAPRDRALWTVLRGDTPLPLKGNAANFTRLLQQTGYFAAGLSPLPQGARLDAAGHCRTAGDAERLRGALGGILLLAGLVDAKVEAKDRMVVVSVELTERSVAALLDSVAK